MKLPRVIKIKNLLKFQILYHLSRKNLCGDELADLLNFRKNRKLTPGTIYPALKFLKKKKLVKYKQKGRKKIYYLTKFGKEEYNLSRNLFNKMFRIYLISSPKSSYPKSY